MAKLQRRDVSVTLFDANDSFREIKKHSSMVQMSNVTTLQERKVMNTLIRIAKDTLKRRAEEYLFVSDLGMIKRLAWLSDNDNESLKDALRNLANTSVEYNIFNKDKKERGVFSILAEAKIKEQGRGKPTYVSFQFPATVLEVIKNPYMYVKLDLLVIRGLKSKHSIALYELLKDYQNLWKFRARVEDFRRLMGIKPDQYKVFTMVKKRVLEVAIQEINEKTDLLVGYELENEGRKIAAIVFMIQSKDSVELLDDTQEVIWQKLKEFGIKEKQIKELLQKHDEQYLRANIAVVEEHAKTKDISNITGYLLKAISDDFRPRISAFKHQQKEKKNGKIEESQEEIEKKALLLKTKRNFEEQRSVALEKVLAEKNEAEITSLKDQFIAEKSHSSIMKSLIENKWFENPIIHAQRNGFLSAKFLPDELVDFEVFRKKYEKSPSSFSKKLDGESTREEEWETHPTGY